MRYIVRQIGKYDPVFDGEVDWIANISHKVRPLIAYVSYKTDDDPAVVINITDATDVYVERNPDGCIDLKSV